MAGKSSFVYALLLLGFTYKACSGQTTADCNAANGVGSWMGDGTCDPQNLVSECHWDGGDCCRCTCDNDDDDNDYACGTDGYLCLDPTFRGNSTCEEESLPACPVYNQNFVVENTTHAKDLATMINCTSGTFHVEWRGNVVVDTEIVVSYGTFLNVTGTGSSAVLDGGRKTRLFRVVSSSLQMNNVEIRNANATFGGAIMAINSTLALHRTSFIGNTATDKNGGSVFLYRSNISFGGQTDFFYNSCANYGGALYAVSNSSIFYEGVSNFTGNSAYYSGGALGVVVGSTVSWETETTFERNAASIYLGGALFLERRSSASWNDEANFIANSALFGGGAIFVDLGSNASWSGGAIFFNNTAAFAGGGAILIADSSTLQFSGETSFELNSCLAGGGAISSRAISSSCSQQSSLVFTGPTTFADNMCTSNGGGIAIESGLSASFGSSNITFIGNEAGVNGGGVFISTVDEGPIFDNITFDSNSAQVGGGVYVSGSGTSTSVSSPSHQWSATFDGCRFIDNKAETTGGAIEIDSGTANVTNTLFRGNKAGTGGALLLSAFTHLQGCTFEGNLADVNGAPAISLIWHELEIENCSFSGNSFVCDVGTYINESESGDRFEFVCSGCDNCESCTMENRRKVPTSCSEALEHSTSPGGQFVTLETLSIDPGYWRATNESTNILKCYNEDACLGGMTGSPHFCNESYMGPYCAVCTEPYVKGPGFTCIKCYDNVWGILATAVVVAIVVVVAILVFIFLATAEMIETVHETMARLLRRVPLHSIKIIIVAWQIVTQFSTATGLTYPGLYQHFLDAVSVFNFDLPWLLSAACVIDVDFHGRLLIVTIGPIMVMLLLSGSYTYVLYRHHASGDTLRNLRNKHMSMILFVMFLVYSTSSSVVFQMFDCEVLDDGKDYLRADYTIECDKPRHRALMIYSGFMILMYPLGIPAFFACLLFQNREVLIDATSRKESLSVRPISDLWKPYRASRFYYEVIECGRRIILTGVILTIDYDSAAQIAITLVLSFVFTVMSEGLAPYESRWDAWISRLGHAVVFCSVYYALLLKVDVSEERNKSRETFEVVLVVTHIVMVVLVICEATLAGCLFQEEGQVEDPLPRSNRHRPGRFRGASFPLRGAWLEPLDSLDTDENEAEVRVSSMSRYGNPNRLGSRSRPSIVPLHIDPDSERTEPV